MVAFGIADTGYAAIRTQSKKDARNKIEHFFINFS
jgi:hypothetical protein